MKSRPHTHVFELTEEDIKSGIARSSRFCPVAEAIKRDLPQMIHVDADLTTIRWSNPATRKRYVFMTPKIVRSFIVMFDRGNKKMRLEPFAFRLQPPVQILEMKGARANRDRSQEYAKRKSGKATIIKGTRIGGKPLPVTDNAQRNRRFGLRELME